MKKQDAVISLIIGFLIGIFFFIIFKNIEIKIPYLWLLIAVFPFLSLAGMYLVSILGRKFLTIYQVGKFALAGALSTFIDLGILNILIWMSGIAAGFLYSVFKGVSFLISVINGYFWNKCWTFEKSGEPFRLKEFFKFLAVATIGLSINVGIASIIVNKIGPQFGISITLWASVGAIVATLFAWIWNFLSSKFIVFKQ